MNIAQLAEAVEYTDCFSAEELDPPPNNCPWYDTKQSDAMVPVLLELWGMRTTPSLPLLPGLLWSGVEVPYRVLSMRQIELNCVLMLNWIVWKRTVFDIEAVYLCWTELFEIELFLCIKMDLVLIQWSISQKPNQTKLINYVE